MDSTDWTSRVVQLNYEATVRLCWIAFFAKFLGEEIRAEMRRLLFSLLNTIAASGYHIRLFDSVPPYAQWFDLHLEHLQHCIEFDDKADLLAELNAETGAEHIAGMRQRAVDYCDDYLAPESFIHKFEARERQLPKRSVI